MIESMNQTNLERKITSRLISWAKAEHHKPLLLHGARQVGKTFTVREFSKQYDTFIELNFLTDPSYTELFQDSLSYSYLSLMLSVTFDSYKPGVGKTLLFLDEIQACPNAITALKFLAGHPDLDVIASGSELGITYSHPSSFPVGYVEFMEMNGLDFEEYLWARKIPNEMISLIKECFQKGQQIPTAMHNKMNALFKEYMVLGGMPEVCRTWIDTASFQAAFTVQHQILQGYLIDIAHLAPAEMKIKAQNVYSSIPNQLMKDNRKFQYKVVETGGNARKFSGSIDWLSASRFVADIHNVSDIREPLVVVKDPSDFRLYPTEIGLLMASLPASSKGKLLQNSGDSQADLGPTKGGLFEALAVDLLWKSGFQSLYFFKSKKNNMEIEFLIESNDGIHPIEIKAGRSRSRSLDMLLQEHPELTGYKFGNFNIGISGSKITAPLYCLSFLSERIKKFTLDSLI